VKKCQDKCKKGGGGGGGGEEEVVERRRIRMCQMCFGLTLVICIQITGQKGGFVMQLKTS
jgi:hypothetical protein